MMWGYGPYDMGYGGSGWHMLFGGGLWLLFAVLVVFAVVWITRSASHGYPHGSGPRRSSGLDVLEERYARGEINREEFLQKKRDLGS